MFNPTELVIDSFVAHLRNSFARIYTTQEPAYPGIIDFVGRAALENIANSDASYHDVNHTIMVTLVGQEILTDKHMLEGSVAPSDWLHFIISLLCHDIGYVRGICKKDNDGEYVSNMNGGLVALPVGATDASLTPYHIDRAKLFVRERFGSNKILDTGTIEANIEHTRFPFLDGKQWIAKLYAQVFAEEHQAPGLGPERG